MDVFLLVLFTLSLPPFHLHSPQTPLDPKTELWPHSPQLGSPAAPNGSNSRS